jgi:hypothetical protein
LKEKSKGFTVKYYPSLADNNNEILFVWRNTLKRAFVFSIAVFLACVLPGFTQAAPGAAGNPVDVTIRYYDKTIYYPGNTADNPVYVQVTIKNNSPETFRFKLADDRSFSVDFAARNMRNILLTQTNILTRKRTTSQTVYFREIALESGEGYSFVENLKDYLIISEPSVYYLDLQFYPELYKSKATALTSNRLAFEVQPSPGIAASIVLPVDTATLAVLTPEQIPPDRVVEQTIIARQQGHWDQYFLYMDIEQIFMKDQVRNRQYRSASAAERERLLLNYRAGLMQARIDRDIVAVPMRFTLERTMYSPTEGTVAVLEWFPYETFTEKKRYTYYVRQRDGIWQIYDFVVENLGTE